MMTPLPGATTTKPGSATFPFFGVVPVLLDDQGNEIDGNPAEGRR
jgi:acetyl-CoA synthetase